MNLPARSLEFDDEFLLKHAAYLCYEMVLGCEYGETKDVARLEQTQEVLVLLSATVEVRRQQAVSDTDRREPNARLDISPAASVHVVPEPHPVQLESEPLVQRMQNLTNLVKKAVSGK